MEINWDSVFIGVKKRLDECKKVLVWYSKYVRKIMAEISDIKVQMKFSQTL